MAMNTISIAQSGHRKSNYRKSKFALSVFWKTKSNATTATTTIGPKRRTWSVELG